MNDEKRWESERAYFDDEEYVETEIPPSTVKRYSLCPRPWLAAEFPFHVLGDVRGKYILEVGSGDGGNAILLALKGARVVGVDISPQAVEIAKRRATLQGVAETTAFFASPLELFQPPNGEKFDVICGWAILHHLIPVLDEMLSAMAKIAKPNAMLLFSEPIVVWAWLRKLRLKLPIPLRGTPDERPLEPAEFAILRKHVPDLQITYFNASLRIVQRFWLRGRYEDLAPFWRRLYDETGRIDKFLLNSVGLEGLASIATLFGEFAAKQ